MEIDEIVVTLTNESGFYEEILPWIRKYLTEPYPESHLEIDVVRLNVTK